jgi:hypothetical protein
MAGLEQQMRKVERFGVGWIFDNGCSELDTDRVNIVAHAVQLNEPIAADIIGGLMGLSRDTAYARTR